MKFACQNFSTVLMYIYLMDIFDYLRIFVTGESRLKINYGSFS
jgi:hypothetical protein